MVKVRRGGHRVGIGVLLLFSTTLCLRTLPLAMSLQSAVPTPCRLKLGFCYYDKAVV